MPAKPQTKAAREEARLGCTGADYLVRHTTLRQLQLLEAIVRLGSFTRAAEELFLTQPTVSMQIKKLSETLGTPLFHHVGRTVEPTDAGREVYAACRDILNSLANLETKLADLQGLKRGRLRLGVITTATYVAPEILGAFCQRHTGIDVSLNVTNRDQLLERLAAQDDDLYVMGQQHQDLGNDVHAVPFAPNPLVMVARSDHPLVGQAGILMERLAAENLLLREPGSGVRDAVLKHFATVGVEPRVRMQLGSTEAIKHAILGGLGISALSLHSVRLESGGGRFAVLDVVGFPIRRRWHIVYSRARELSLVARTFLEFAVASEPDIRTQLEEAMATLMRVSDVPQTATLDRLNSPCPEALQ